VRISSESFSSVFPVERVGEFYEEAPGVYCFYPFKENKLTLVATDGRRLALFDSDLEFPHSHERDFIVPTKAVTELQRLLGEEGEVQISVGENLVK